MLFFFRLYCPLERSLLHTDGAGENVSFFLVFDTIAWCNKVAKSKDI